MNFLYVMWWTLGLLVGLYWAGWVWVLCSRWTALRVVVRWAWWLARYPACRRRPVASWRGAWLVDEMPPDELAAIREAQAGTLPLDL